MRELGELHGVRTGPVGRWTYAHRKALRAGVTGAVLLIFVFWGRPTAAVVAGLVVALLIALGLMELIGRPPAQPARAAPRANG